MADGLSEELVLVLSAAYARLDQSGALERTVAFKDLKPQDFQACLLPGGHIPEMRSYLEDETLQRFVREFAAVERIDETTATQRVEQLLTA